MATILLIEDDPALIQLYESVLNNQGFKTLMANDGLEALDILEHSFVDLIITDIMMPNMDGFTFSEALKDANIDIPIIMITAKDSFEDKKRGFSMDIDDYMVKPIDVNEMVLRVNAILRRAKIAHNQQLQIGETILDQETLSITIDNDTQDLPLKEFQLLFKLLSYPNRIFTRQELMDEFWGFDTETDPRTIDVHIKRLRSRVRDNEDFEIKTVRGLGYKAEVLSDD